MHYGYVFCFGKFILKIIFNGLVKAFAKLLHKPIDGVVLDGLNGIGSKLREAVIAVKVSENVLIYDKDGLDASLHKDGVNLVDGFVLDFLVFVGHTKSIMPI